MKAQSKPAENLKPVSDFHLEAELDELRSYLQRKVDGMQATEEDQKQRMKRLLNAFLPSKDLGPGTESSSLALFRKAESLMAESQRLLEKYASISRFLDGLIPPAVHLVASQWQGDVEKLENLLDAGKRIAERRIEQIVGGNNHADKNQEEESQMLGKGIAGENHYEVASVFFGKRKADDSKTVGEALDQGYRAVKRIARTVLKEDLDE